MRFFFRFEIEHLVARSKLALEAIHGDFAGPRTGSREFVVTGSPISRASGAALSSAPSTPACAGCPGGAGRGA
jgi:hypothetical protein